MFDFTLLTQLPTEGGFLTTAELGDYLISFETRQDPGHRVALVCCAVLTFDHVDAFIGSRWAINKWVTTPFGTLPPQCTDVVRP